MGPKFEHSQLVHHFPDMLRLKFLVNNVTLVGHVGEKHQASGEKLEHHTSP